MSRSNPSKPIKPWAQPGFRFYTHEMRAWLGGYEPTIADAIVKAKKPGITHNEPGSNAFGVKGGTIPAFGRAAVADTGKAIRMSKPSQM